MSEESNSKYNILIVDDDQFLLKMYVLKFDQEGFNTEAVTSGEEALNKLREGYKPDVIILDIIMPGMDGIEILENIKKEKLAPEAALVMLTNQSGEKEREKVKDFNVDGYIIKATTVPSEVVSRIKEIVENKK